MPNNSPSDDDLSFLLDDFDPADPRNEFRIILRRVIRLGREKEQLEAEAREMRDRLSKVEHLFKDGVFGVEPATLRWLAKLDEEKLKQIDANVQFMSNAQFMGKWTWRGLALIVSIVGGIAGIFTWVKGIKL